MAIKVVIKLNTGMSVIESASLIADAMRKIKRLEGGTIVVKQMQPRGREKMKVKL